MNGLYYDLLLAPFERLIFSKERRWLAARASGRVLEVGIGTGQNLSHYPPRVVTIEGIDPDASMLGRARHRAERAAMRSRLNLKEGTAEALPFGEAEFDTVLATLVLCSVDDPKRAITEIVRVLRPGGLFLVIEHVRHERERVGHLLDLLTPAWARIADGCHLNRNPEPLLRKAGLEFLENRVLWKGFGRAYVLKKPEQTGNPGSTREQDAGMTGGTPPL